MFNFLKCLCIACVLGLGSFSIVSGQENLKKEALEEPIVVNGDTVEYSTDNREISATGNVLVIYRGTRLTCQKLSVNTQTKDAKAQGDVRVEDSNGVIEGQTVGYNFESKKGGILDAEFRSSPYFGKASKIERLGESEFIAFDGYATTCSLDHPHYRIGSKQINVFPGKKIQTKNNFLYAGSLPCLYLPQYNHSLRDSLYHVQMTPGKSGDWGAYLLSGWRTEFNENVKTRVYVDYRHKLGLAEGFGVNYNSLNQVRDLGAGDFKFYYTHERPSDITEGPSEFERYLLRWRHNWEIDPRTRAVAEVYKIRDSKTQLGTDVNFLKDYFYREYEKDVQPKSYVMLSHAFNYSSLSFYAQPRLNDWYTHTSKIPDEKLPEVTYNLPEYKLGESPLYFKNISIFSNLANREAAPSSVEQEILRADTFNQFSLPFKASIFRLNPFAGSRETFYSRDKEGNSLNPRTIFYSGLEASTKFYRTSDFQSNFLGFDFNGLRHIITPALRYNYNHEPTIPSSRLETFDDLDTLEASNKISLELTNKLQTKRKDKGGRLYSVDFATFKVSSDYIFEPEDSYSGHSGSNFSDFLFDLELIPYSWLRLESDLTYDHFIDDFKSINFDAYASIGKDKSVGLGHRYERMGGNEMTGEFNWRFTPKWSFRAYERFQFAKSRDRGLKEQEYGISRDLHCVTMGLTYNVSEFHGHTVWMTFKLKAFPENELTFDQSYHTSKTGSQTDTLH